MRAIKSSLLFVSLLTFIPVGVCAESGAETFTQQRSQTPSPSLNPDKDIDNVRILAKEGKYKEALNLLNPYSTAPNQYPKIYTDYLVILVWADKSQEAIQRFESLPQSFSKRVYLLEAMAKGYSSQKQYIKAVELYETVIAQDSDNSQAQLGLIQNLINIKQYQKASNLLNTYLAKNPGEFPLLLIQAGILMQQGEYLASLKTYQKLAENNPQEKSSIALQRENSIAALSSANKNIMLTQLKKALTEGQSNHFLDYLLSLVLHSDFYQAIHEFEKSGKPLSDFSLNHQYWLAWAYFKKGNTGKAEEIYNGILEKNPVYDRAKLGIIYCMAKNKKGKEALQKLHDLKPQKLDAQFAQAYIFEQSQRFYDALKIYDDILKQTKSETAEKLKLQVIASLGAPSIALKQLPKKLPDDENLQRTFLGDFAMDDIHWQEPQNALSNLSNLLDNNHTLRNKYDYLIALAENEDLAEARSRYEEFVQQGIFTPYWIKNNAAKAYLYFDEPREALHLYNEAIKQEIQNKIKPLYDSRLGKYYSLQDLRLWKEAEEVLASLQNDYPLFSVLKNGKKIPSDEGEELVIIRGWSLAAQDRFKEAEDFFTNLYSKGPGNLKIRNGLAHTHYWRGWPRKALREFNIINTHDPEYVAAATGRIVVLNELVQKEEAREYAKALLTKQPRNRNIQRINHLLDVEQMREIVTDVVWYQEEPDNEDILVKVALFQPLSLQTRLFGFWLWNEISDRKLLYHVKRAGLGIDHLFNSTWKIRQQFSINYDTGKEFGSLTKVNFSPNDYWSAEAEFDSFAVDIPMRARVHGIDAKKYAAGVTYRESDWRSYSIGISRYDFSDGNNRDQIFLNFQQGLWTKYDWKFRMLIDFSNSKNSLNNVVYFNPAHDYSLSATLLTEKLVRQTTSTSFKHRLFLTAGIYDQANFDPEPIWIARYEQEYDFSDEHALLIGATWENRAYDGIASDSLALYLTYRYHF